MCLAQGHNTVTLIRLEPATPRTRVKYSTTEPLCLKTEWVHTFCHRDVQKAAADDKADSFSLEWQ